jgi:protein-histidine pros-kinase
MEPNALEQAKRTLQDLPFRPGAVAGADEPRPIKTTILKTAASAKDPLLGRLSHALRTPLNAIVGFTGTLLMELPGPLTDDQREQLKLIKTSAWHHLALINDLLDLVKIETGQLSLALMPTDIGALIGEVAVSLQPLAESKGLGFAVRLPENVIVETDRRALRQILVNLTSNAINFTSRGGVQIELRQGNGATEIAVHDTGIGIDPLEQRDLFTPFARLEHAGVECAQGTGLGLHLNQKLAALLNARITVESGPGRGSKFTLILDGKTNGNS